MNEASLLKPQPLPGEILADLLPIVGEIGAVLDQDALLPAIAKQLRRIVDYKILDIFLPRPDGVLYPAYVDGYEKHDAWRYTVRPGEGIVGTAAVSREVVFVADVTKDPIPVDARTNPHPRARATRGR